MTCLACADAPGLAGVQARLGAAARQDAVAGEVVLPLIEALHAFWEGDYAGAAGRLEALAPSLGRLSEFPDQLGVFQETQRRARALAGA